MKEITPELNKKQIIIPVLSNDEWAALAELLSVLKFPLAATLSMQKEKYVSSDLFGDWMELKLQLEKIRHIEVAADMLDSMKGREIGLIDAPHVLASVYIDPRFRVLLSEEECTIAQNTYPLYVGV